MGLDLRPISTTVPPPKIQGGGQAPLGLARLDYPKARPGGAVNGGAQVRRSS